MPGEQTVTDRIRVLCDLVRDVSRDPDPASVIRRFSSAMREVYGPWALFILSVRGLTEGSYRITRFVDHTGRERVESKDVWRGDPSAPVRSGGLLGEAIARARPHWRADVHAPRDPVLGEDVAPYRSLMAIPAFDEGEVANWLVFLHPNPRHFTDADLEWGVLRVNLLAATANNKDLYRQLRAANAWIEGEVDLIAEIQRSLLPLEGVRVPGLDVATSWQTFDRAGGDYYDFLPLGKGAGGGESWAILVADASGHGPAAAVITAMLHVLLRSLPEACDSPVRLLGLMHDRLFACPTCNHFMTAFVGIWEPSARRLRYAAAGHHPPLLRRAGEAAAELPLRPALPLGILAAHETEEGQIELRPGDVLTLYTDGLVDSVGPRGEAFGMERLRDALSEAQGDANAIRDALLGALHRHEADTRATDDQALVILRVPGA